MRCDWRGSEKLGIDYADVKKIYTKITYFNHLLIFCLQFLVFLVWCIEPACQNSYSFWYVGLGKHFASIQALMRCCSRVYCGFATPTAVLLRAQTRGLCGASRRMSTYVNEEVSLKSCKDEPDSALIKLRPYLSETYLRSLPFQLARARNYLYALRIKFITPRIVIGCDPHVGQSYSYVRERDLNIYPWNYHRRSSLAWKRNHGDFPKRPFRGTCLYRLA